MLTYIQFVGLECLMTSLVDLFPTYLRQGYRRELALLAVCSTCCLLGFSLVTEVSSSAGAAQGSRSIVAEEGFFVCLLVICWQGGMYLLQLLDHHVCSGTTLLLLALCQSISIGWVYGEAACPPAIRVS